MGHRTAGSGHRVLIVAPYGRDAASVSDLLTKHGYDALVCAGLEEAAGRLDDHTGVVLMTEEALSTGLDHLIETVGRQPAWSDVPFVVLAAQRGGRMRPMEAVLRRLPETITNTVVLERPLGSASLLSAIKSAMRSRQKQFVLRDQVRRLADSESRLRLATDAGDIGTWDLDPVNGALSWDTRCRAIFGVSPDMPVDYEGTFVAGLHPDDRDATCAAVQTALDPGGDGTYDIEYRTIGLEDGVERWAAARGGALFDEGVAVRFVGTIIDITRRKRAEAQLAASQRALEREKQELDRLNRTLEEKVAERTAALEAEAESRNRIEAALRQSQKMEAVGQLTGGIAHDFNNMLTGVIGAMDIMKRRLANGRTDDLGRFMDAASASAQRAAALTARLLAFSRRQSLDAQPVDVNELIASLDELLLRSVHENIRLSVAPGDRLPAAIADANQLENAVLNLAINARDAMPDGGLLTIETGVMTLDEAYAAAHPEVTPGDYVTIAVSDTGVGMPADVLERVFEPFFSTKPTGQGTGLGLSMVYGFARQSGGQVRVHSQPGEGTSVRIFLPAAPSDTAAVTQDERPPATEGRGQTVLLVEDDESVRMLVRDVLEELRYRTIEAGSADEALPLIVSDQPIDLMVSDVGLPGMSGRQLGEIVRRYRPDLPILFVTGYAENAAIRAGFLGTNMAMITKPFVIEDLSARIAAMMPD